ncbi:CPBP family glutamic-type intramembrane protease [Microvirga sp. BSC39]|uniref:CPBP family glutamic-type intramembrane protease n=1 Tax=Microvirga sp. BSC39 TaxID=1549810 RepID=UPI0004E8D39F|nr:CPBP family glutamic-type intramembrane protease [Microvirga sp. BSC39]KFG68014.1 hypothetical protein JH26_19030 [Microvirga sp. BSC39]
MKSSAGFLKPFLVMSGLGLLGVLALIPLMEASIEQASRLPGAPALSRAALALLLLGQPAVILLFTVALGVALTEKAGLTSLILRHLRGDPLGPAAKGWGSTLALAILFASSVALADLILRGAFPAAFERVPRLDEVTLAGRLLGLLYGGITEELMMRFGLMTLLLWLGLRLTGGRGRSMLTWTAVLLTALIFAAGHLGAAAPMMQADDHILLVRTLALNGILGLLFGGLYACRSLEHAMLAHMASHVVFWIATPLLVALGF